MRVGFDSCAAEKVPIASQALPWRVGDVVDKRREARLFTVGVGVGDGKIVGGKLARGDDTENVSVVGFVRVLEHVDETLTDFRMCLQR